MIDSLLIIQQLGERYLVFSTAGLAVNAMRSSLALSTVDKVVFVNENAHFVNDSCE